MNVLLLSVDFPPHRDGVSVYAGQVARALAARGHRVTVVAPRAEGDAESDAGAPFRVYRFRGYAWGLARGIPFAWAAWRALRAARPDVVLPMNVGYGGLWCWALGWFRRLPYVTFAYAYEFLKVRRVPPLRRLYRSIYARSRGVLAISRFTRDRLAAFGVDAARIRVLPPGVDAPPDYEGPPPPRREFTLGTCGRLIARKGHATVIRALASLGRAFPALRYRIAGDGPERSRLEALARELGVAERVTFLGAVPDAELGRFYRGLDLFVMPSRDDGRSGHVEGFGIVFLEAAVRGVPAIASATGGIPEAVVDGVTGRLVVPDAPEDLAQAILECLVDPRSLRRMGEAARARALGEFGWERIGDELNTWLAAVVPGAACPVPARLAEAMRRREVAGHPVGASQPGAAALRVAVLTRTGAASGVALAAAVGGSRHALCGVLAERRWTMVRRMIARRSLRTLWRELGPGFLAARLWRLVRGSGGADSGRGLPAGTAYRVVPDLNGDNALAQLEAWRPDVLIVANAPILAPRVFGAAPLGAVNFHSGRLPKYGGVASEFWAIHDGRTEAWATLHRVEARLDSGAILAECAVPIAPGDTPDALHARCVAAAGPLLVGVLDRLAAGDCSAVRDPGPAVLRRWPTARERRAGRSASRRRTAAS